MPPGIILGSLVGRSGATLMARVTGNDGALIKQASFAAIAWQLSDRLSNTVPSGATGTFVVASVIFDSLQQADPRWTADSRQAPGPTGDWGYNFLATLPAALFPAESLPAGFNSGPGPHPYQVDVRFTPSAGEVFTIVYLLSVYPTFYP